jgi:uracil-DNA glycosylase
MEVKDKIQLTTEQFQVGLAQLLRTYAGAGLKRFNKSGGRALPADIQKQLAHWQSAQSTDQSSHADSAVSVSSQATGSDLLDRSLSDVSANDRSTSETVSGTSARPAARAAAQVGQQTIDVPAVAAPLGQWQTPALDLAERQARLTELDSQVRACRKCDELVCYRRQTVFGEGNLRPRVCFYGEAPGADEDAQGRPFVGAAGKLLTDIIRAMRLTREEVYILNSLKCRPPQNRTPLPDEVDNCRPYALAQLEILQPEYIVLLGAVAVRSVLQSTEPVGRLRGRFHRFHGAKVLVTYHPAYLLRNAEAKKLVWADVQLVMRGLAAGSSSSS